MIHSRDCRRRHVLSGRVNTFLVKHNKQIFLIRQAEEALTARMSGVNREKSLPLEKQF